MPRPLAGTLLTIVAGLLAAGALAVFAAPDRIEHVRLDANTPAAADAAYATVFRWADGETTLHREGNAVLIDRKAAAFIFATQPADTPADGTALGVAHHALDALRENAAPPATPAAPIVDATQPIRRAGLQARLETAESDRAALSVQLTGIVHAIAGLQATQVAAGDTATPGRALLGQLQARRIDLLARYTTDFPGIAITDAEIAQVQAQIAHDDAHQPHPVAALATLDTERNRLTQALTEAQTRRDTLADRLAALDAEAAAGPAAAPTSMPPVAPEAFWSLRRLEPTTTPDRRPIGWATIAVLVFVTRIPWRRGRHQVRARRRPEDGFSAHVAFVGAAVRLPVLRCLDMQGDPLAPSHARPLRSRAPVLVAQPPRPSLPAKVANGAGWYQT